jgi:alcohol dehydrogenase (NADP+)
MEKLVRPNGPVRYIGVSNLCPSQMNELLASATIRPKVHQFELHPYLQQSDWLDFHLKNNITVTGYAPLGNTSPYYRFASNNNPTKPPILLDNPVIQEIAKARGCTGAQVSLAWNMKRGVAVIPKSSHLARQKENMEALKRCKLTDEDSKKIQGISAKWAGRFNNPCKMIGMKCFAGLYGPDQGI